MDCDGYAYFVKMFGEPEWCNKALWLASCKEEKRALDLGLLIPQGLYIKMEKGVVTMVKK
jgi:hypothetical protein